MVTAAVMAGRGDKRTNCFHSRIRNIESYGIRPGTRCIGGNNCLPERTCSIVIRVGNREASRLSDRRYSFPYRILAG